MSTALPGGGDFLDVTKVFEDASNNMDPGDVLLTDGFTLYDAMTALEIGDPRMDSGVILDEQRRPPFDPLALLLPEELCYILDRSVVCEMLWHRGHTLSQTVYTFLYVHYHHYLDPDAIPADILKERDTSRPFELITIVLRGALIAYMKCCDLAWREMSKGRIYDTEDCQLEKSEVSLAENVPTGAALSRLEDAIFWVEDHLPHTSLWRMPLLDRLRLRQALLDLFRADPTRVRSGLRPLIDRARSALNRVRYGTQPPIPPPNSAAALALDPYVTRKLNNIMPLQPLVLPSQGEAWDTLALLLSGFEDLCRLSIETRLSSWKIIGSLRASQDLLRPSFIRSLIQNTFYNGVYVLGTNSSTWLIDHFFMEALGLSSASFTIIPRAPDVQQKIIKLLSKRIQCDWYNFPRRRRHLVNSLFDWSALYFRLRRLTDAVEARDQAESFVLKGVPKIALLWRLECLREIVLSGFKLELYAPHEKAFAYWYLHRILSDHLAILNEIDTIVPTGSITRQDLSVSRPLLSALQTMCEGMFAMTMPLIMAIPAERMYLSFLKRYKWAFLPQYAQMHESISTMPDYDEFIDACDAKLKDNAFSPADCFERSRDLLAQLTSTTAGSVSAWHDECSLFFLSLSGHAAQLAGVLPTSLKGIPDFDQGLFDWHATDHRWFPAVRLSPS